MSANRHWLTNVGKLMSAVPSHDFETRRSCSNEIAASNVTHSHRKRSGGHYQEKEKGEVHARCIGVHIVGEESATRRWRLRPTSPSSSSSSSSLSDRRFRSPAIPTSTSGSPSPSHGITPVYLHRVYYLPPSNHVLSLPESSSSPRRRETPKFTRENRTYLKASLCWNRLPKAVTKLPYIETRRSAGMSFFITENSERIIARVVAVRVELLSWRTPIDYGFESRIDLTNLEALGSC